MANFILKRKTFGVGAFLGKMTGTTNLKNAFTAGNGLTMGKRAAEFGKGALKATATTAAVGGLAAGATALGAKKATDEVAGDVTNTFTGNPDK